MALWRAKVKWEGHKGYVNGPRDGPTNFGHAFCKLNAHLYTCP